MSSSRDVHSCPHSAAGSPQSQQAWEQRLPEKGGRGPFWLASLDAGLAHTGTPGRYSLVGKDCSFQNLHNGEVSSPDAASPWLDNWLWKRATPSGNTMARHLGAGSSGSNPAFITSKFLNPSESFNLPGKMALGAGGFNSHKCELLLL